MKKKDHNQLEFAFMGEPRHGVLRAVCTLGRVSKGGLRATARLGTAA